MAIPAKNAPRANETPNRAADPNAMPTAAAKMHNVKSSRTPVRATCQSNHGNTRRPTTSISRTKRATLPRVNASARMRLLPPAAPAVAFAPPSQPETGGSSTRRRTMTRSSTTSHPKAMSVDRIEVPLLCRAVSSTTVLATEGKRERDRPGPSPNGSLSW
jgi:hypothetical protein